MDLASERQMVKAKTDVVFVLSPYAICDLTRYIFDGRVASRKSILAYGSDIGKNAQHVTRVWTTCAEYATVGSSDAAGGTWIVFLHGLHPDLRG